MKSVKALALGSCILVISPTQAQPDWEWARIAGGGSVEYEGGLAIGTNGAVYVSFSTSGGRLGTFSTPQAGNIWGKLDGQNNVQIAKSGPGSFFPGNLKIAANKASDIFFSGWYYRGLNMGGFSAGAPDWGAVIGRMDLDCNVTWMKSVDVSRDYPLSARALTTDNLGNLVLATTFQRLSFDGQELGATPGSGGDVAVVKVRPDGALIWMKKGGGNGSDEPWGVDCDSVGNVYVGGRYTETPIFGTITLPRDNNGGNGFLVKYTASGDITWARSWGQTSQTKSFIDTISDVKINSQGRVFVVGVLGAAEWEMSASSGMGFLSEISPDGNDLWTKTFPMGVHPFSLAPDANGGVSVASSFFGSFQMDGSTAVSRGQADVLITSHDSTGKVRWAQSGGSATSDYPLQLKYGIDGSLFVIGITTGTAVFGSNLIDGIGNTDIFIAKLSPDAAQIPRFTAQPQSVAVSGGMKIELKSSALGDLPLTYQWWFNGSPLPGQTSTSLVFAKAAPENSGSYFVVARNSAGEAQSDIANVSFSDAAALQLSLHPSLTIFGTPGRTYRIEAAPETRSPAVWTTITNISLPAAPYVWQDTNAAIGDRRLYRVLLQP